MRTFLITLRKIDVLAQDVGVLGLFSDWIATTMFHANCKKLAAMAPTPNAAEY